MTTPADFWLSSGYFLLDRGEDGRLSVTDDFLRAFLRRPEMQPVEESCAAERALNAALIDDPRQPVAAARIARMQDPDMRENYETVLRFRDRLLAHASVEGFYLDAFRRGTVDVPPMFLDQIAHVILRSVLAETRDPLRLRAAETLFRTQKVTIREGAVLLADEEFVERYAESANATPLAQLLAQAGAAPSSVELDVLDESNKAIYFDRSDRFDTVIDISFARPGLDALCRVLESWVRHFLAVDVSVQPVQSIRDERWVWHIGLDNQSTGILNDLYRGAEVADDRLRRILSLFRLEFCDPAVMMPRIAGRPVYLGLAMGPDNAMRLKPQNILTNLPLSRTV